MPQTLTTNRKEKNMISRAYRNMLKAIPTLETENDKKLIRSAFELAVSAHSGQRRKSGEPYVLHPIEVARICAAEIGLGPTAVIAALLHDVVEDTKTSLEEIEEKFGKKIRDIVDGLTKLDSAYNVDSHQAENFKKVLSTLVEDVRVVLIKMADRLHNMRTISSMPRHKQLRIAAETDYIYAPLSHRLGLYNVKTELKDLCFKVTEPEHYHEIARKLNETREQRQSFIKSFIEPIRKEINQLDVPYRITGRPKSIYSIWNKIRTKKVPFEEIYDLFAIRIIVDVPVKSEKSICWQVYSIITDVHTPIPERLKDWITTPKSNGYESLHTTVIGPQGKYVEVQIRSERMDDIAERGFAAHWKYKGVKNDNSVYDHWLENIRDLLDNNDGDAIDFVNDFKTNLFKEEVYVYTPAGDMNILPKGATALDFAFSIHTEVGASCTSAKVNNKLVPLSYELQNGDQVKILTSKNQKPSEHWLKMVTTGKARSKIRTSIRKEKKELAEYGKETLQRKLKKLKVNFENNIDFLVRHFGYNNHSDFFFDIEKEKFDLVRLKELEVRHQDFVLPEKEHNKKEEVQEATSQKSPEIGEAQLLIDGEPASKYEYHFANCCNPVRGDDIFGFLTTGSGVKVHRYRCPNAMHLLANFSYRVVKAEWTTGSNYQFASKILVTGIDSGVGVIEKITKQISSFLGLNIRSFSIEGEGGYFEGKIGLNVVNKKQLEDAIVALENLEGISNVTRID